MPRIPARVVKPLSGRTTVSTARAESLGLGYDVAIGGISFMLASSTEMPYRRQTAPYKKDQVDTEAEPGEQSLTGWWLRSQASFHDGAGILYQETVNTFGTAQVSNRFRDSMGIDPWTQGQISLLKTTSSLRTATSACDAIGAIDGTTPVAFMSDGTNLRRIVDESTSAAVTWGGANSIQSLTSDPASYYAADSVGIYKGTLAGGAGAKIWNTGTSPVVIAWMKQRLVAGIGPSIYELISGGPTLPTALYTHPAANWAWTSLAEGPNAIYASGYAGGTSAIVRFALTTAGVMPTLTSATTVAEFPQGEYVTALFAYLGQYLVIGTNKGVRIGQFQTDGSVNYGPLTWEMPATGGAVMGITGRDRFAYCTASNALPDGTAGLVRIDLSTEDSNGHFAWASDLQAHRTGTVTSVFLLGSRMGFALDTVGSYVEHATSLEATGYLRTGRIRFRTLEPKLFKYVRVRTDAMNGSLSIDAINDADTLSAVITYSTPGVSDQQEAALPSILGPQESFALKFTLARSGTNAALGPVMRSYQIKAIPGGKRQRLITVPLLCFDREKTATGQFLGTDAWSHERFRGLETIEETGDAILYQEFFGRQGSAEDARLVVIDDLDFRQSDPPSGQETRGYGGILIATLRAID